ncbi:hypothetical protein FPV67DRAFT_1562066 [Lyophyllum atratum]|nr:hypothetical protein FPV67DRAFT_1562066 [Lyophyllum atratum]
MSFSPPIRRLSATSASSKEDLINAYEAEEERIINVLSRKLEQLREEKIDLENALEAESESHVNRMARELTALRLAQQGGTSNSSLSASPETGIGFRSFMSGGNRGDPSAETMLEAMRRENEHLRNKLVETERDYIRITRLNEVYREELIDHRRRLGLSVDNLIGLSSTDPYSQHTHRRRSSPVSYSNSSSPATSVMYASTQGARPSHGVPIPRPPSQIHRPVHQGSEGNTPLSHSPSSSESPFLFSPVTNPTSLISPSTNITSAPSSYSFNSNQSMSFTAPRTLSYPSVPPPSLSSSFGSPTVSCHMTYGEHSPAEPSSRRNSGTRRGADWRTTESGIRGISDNNSRRNSVERGARVAETGTLIPRSRTDSYSLPPTTETPDNLDINANAVDAKVPESESKNTTMNHLDLYFSMSYPYGQYPGEIFSNPATPLTFPTWETMENEEAQQAQQQHHTQQIQPPQQPSDLPSPTGPPPHTPLQHQTIQLEEPSHLVPSQPRPVYDDAPIRLHHVHQRPERQRESLRDSESQLLHVETSRSGAPSTSTTGPVRQPRSARHQQQQLHPYRRPSSAVSAAPPSRQQPLLRFASVQPSSSSMPSPAVPSPAMPSPASATSRLASFGSGIGYVVLAVHGPYLRNAPLLDRQRLYLLRTDSYYDPESKRLVTMLEVPGVKKADVRVTLSTCPWNRVRQITVSGTSRPVFPPALASESADGGPELTIRERKFGEFARTFAVPSDTNREDIEASMEDGILTIKVPCGMPVHPNPEDIPIT